MPRTRPPYPPEFRLEAVRMLRAGVRSPKQLAEELGCSAQTLTNWLRQDQADRGERSDVLSSEERQRLRELERENKVLRQEREILKRAVVLSIRQRNAALRAAPTPSSPGSTSRWARSATPGTTRSPRPSSPASPKSCCSANASPPASTPDSGSSGTPDGTALKPFRTGETGPLGGMVVEVVLNGRRWKRLPGSWTLARSLDPRALKAPPPAYDTLLSLTTN